MPISGPLIKEKALIMSVEMGLDDFIASNGWLHRWQQRYNIGSNVLSGDRAEVDEETVNDWSKRLPLVCEGYELNNIFNCDETGLYWRALPSRSMIRKGNDPAGVKTSKDRFTLMLCCSATGEKLQPLMIGKAAKPRAFPKNFKSRYSKLIFRIK